jgi:hypothetical protein
MLYIGIVFLIILSSMILLVIFNRYLPKWFCDHMRWHLAPIAQGFDGCSSTGKCPRCDKKVLQDSQGNWF